MKLSTLPVFTNRTTDSSVYW